MKKVIASAGLVALGAASLQAAYAPGLSSQEASKVWSVSLAVRGFYDDNYNTADDGNSVPKNQQPRDSFGIEVRPSVSVNMPMDQTLLTFGYTYSLKWYEGRSGDEESPYDQQHFVNLGLDHAFNEKCRVTVTDAFAFTSEPDLAVGGGGVPVRSEHNNLNNVAGLYLHHEFTDQFGIVVGYENTLVDYNQDGPGSYSATMDRLEHLFILNLRWQAFPQTIFVFGYQYGIVDYTGDEAIGGGFQSDDRNNTSHYLYVGADKTFNPNLVFSGRIGYQAIDFDESKVGSSSGSPYSDTSLTYTYMPLCSATIGIRGSYSATDVTAPDANGEITGGVRSLAGYLNVLHHFTPDFSTSLMGSFQQNTFDGGLNDDDTETIATIGLSLAYQINQYLAAETGYNFDTVNSDVDGRDYTRNRVYVGLKASY